MLPSECSLDSAVITFLKKIRHTIIVHGLRWEVDEFEGVNKGLVLAENEAENTEALAKVEKKKPAWVGGEIPTDAFKYRNSRRSEHPFTRWHEEEKRLRISVG